MSGDLEKARIQCSDYIGGMLESRSPVSYVVIGDGGTIDETYNGFCWYRLGRDYSGYLNIFPVTSMAVGVSMYMEEGYDEYRRWVVDSSIYSEAFLQSYDQVQEEEIAYMNVSVISQLIVGGLSMLRSVKEHTPCIDFWNEGVKKDLSYEKAAVYAFSHNNMPPMNRLNPNHAPLNFRTVKDAYNFINKHHVLDRQTPFSEDTSYRGFCDMFCSPQFDVFLKGRVDGALMEQLKEL